MRWDQETDRGGNGLSIIGGPYLELNRSRSSQLSCLGSGIPSLVGGFGSKVIKKMWCGFISLDQFRFKGRVIEGTQTLDLFLLYSMAGGLFRIKSVLGRPGKDGLDREAMPTLLVTTKRRSQERKEGLEPSTSALARLCSTIKLFPPAGQHQAAKHY